MYRKLFSKVFSAKNQKLSKVGEIRRYGEETDHFEKNASSFKKAALPKWEGAKCKTCLC